MKKISLIALFIVLCSWSTNGFATVIKWCNTIPGARHQRRSDEKAGIDCWFYKPDENHRGAGVQAKVEFIDSNGKIANSRTLDGIDEGFDRYFLEYCTKDKEPTPGLIWGEASNSVEVTDKKIREAKITVIIKNGIPAIYGGAYHDVMISPAKDAVHVLHIPLNKDNQNILVVPTADTKLVAYAVKKSLKGSASCFDEKLLNASTIIAVDAVTLINPTSHDFTVTLMLDGENEPKTIELKAPSLDEPVTEIKVDTQGRKIIFLKWRSKDGIVHGFIKDEDLSYGANFGQFLLLAGDYKKGAAQPAQSITIKNSAQQPIKRVFTDGANFFRSDLGVIEDLAPGKSAVVALGSRVLGWRDEGPVPEALSHRMEVLKLQIERGPGSGWFQLAWLMRDGTRAQVTTEDLLEAMRLGGEIDVQGKTYTYKPGKGLALQPSYMNVFNALQQPLEVTFVTDFATRHIVLQPMESKTIFFAGKRQTMSWKSADGSSMGKDTWHDGDNATFIFGQNKVAYEKMQSAKKTIKNLSDHQIILTLTFKNGDVLKDVKLEPAEKKEVAYDGATSVAAIAWRSPDGLVTGELKDEKRLARNTYTIDAHAIVTE